METLGDEVHVSSQEASSGETRHIVRYVLLFSLVLAIIALSIVWITGAISLRPSQGDPVTAEENALGG